MKLIILGLVLTALVGNITARTSNVVCYFASWSVYRYGNAKFTVDDIDFTKCTHLIYSFLGLNFDGTIRIMDQWTDFGDGVWNKGLIPNINVRKGATKFIVAMGGWNEGSEVFSQVIGNPTKREILTQDIIKFCKQHDLDGFDLDWEYPTQRGGVPADRQNLAIFIERLYALLKQNGLTLSMATTANSNTILSSYNITHLSENMDMINVMAYDLHGSWESITGHNAPLRKGSSDPTENLNVAHAIQAYLDAGAKPNKLNLGVGTYGRSFYLLNAKIHGMGAAAGGLAPSGWIPEAGFYAYNEICKNNGTEWTVAWDEEQVVPYAYSGNKWVGFDDIASIRAKTCFAKEKNLGGMMVWTIDTDDFKNICGQGRYPLITSIWNGLSDPSCGSDGNVVTPGLPKTTVASPTASSDSTTNGWIDQFTTTTAASPTTSGDSTTSGWIDQSTTTTAASPTTSGDSTTSGWIDKSTTTTAASPTTSGDSATKGWIDQSTATTTQTPVEPSYGSGENEDNDIFEKPICLFIGQKLRHQSDCSSFWFCAPGRTKPEAVLMSCSSGLQYDSVTGVCNYANFVKCA